MVQDNFPTENIEVKMSSDIEIPQVFGFFRAYIYLPESGNFTDEELRMIILHELWHVRGKDLLIKIFYLLIRTVFWWNPITYMFWKELNTLLEFRCDMNTTKHMDESMRVSYLEAILKMVKQYSKVSNGKVLEYGSTLFEGNEEKVIEQRFNMVLNNKAYSKIKTRATVVLLSVVVFICSYFVIWQPGGGPPPEDMEGELILTPDNAKLVREGEDVFLYVEGVKLEAVPPEELKQEPLSDFKIIEEGEGQ